MELFETSVNTVTNHIDLLVSQLEQHYTHNKITQALQEFQKFMKQFNNFLNDQKTIQQSKIKALSMLKQHITQLIQSSPNKQLKKVALEYIAPIQQFIEYLDINFQYHEEKSKILHQYDSQQSNKHTLHESRNYSQNQITIVNETPNPLKNAIKRTTSTLYKVTNNNEDNQSQPVGKYEFNANMLYNSSNLWNIPQCAGNSSENLDTKISSQKAFASYTDQSNSQEKQTQKQQMLQDSQLQISEIKYRVQQQLDQLKQFGKQQVENLTKRHSRQEDEYYSVNKQIVETGKVLHLKVIELNQQLISNRNNLDKTITQYQMQCKELQQLIQNVQANDSQLKAENNQIAQTQEQIESIQEQAALCKQMINIHNQENEGRQQQMEQINEQKQLITEQDLQINIISEEISNQYNTLNEVYQQSKNVIEDFNKQIETVFKVNFLFDEKLTAINYNTLQKENVEDTIKNFEIQLDDLIKQLLNNEEQQTLMLCDQQQAIKENQTHLEEQQGSIRLLQEKINTL